MSSGIHLNRKLLADSFLSGMGLMRIISTGNYWRIVSHPACEQWEPSQQETISKQFPVRHVCNGSHLNRKLFAKSFPSGMGLWCINSTGNDLRKVSCAAWGNWIHLNRKLFAKGFLSGLTQWYSLPTGNCLRRVSCST